MRKFTSIAMKLDAAGLRPLVAKVATLASQQQRFSTNENGFWVNQQPECTIVSPNIHTTKFAAIRDWVLDNTAHCYTPKPGDIIVDVGTGVGEEAVVFSKMIGPSGRIIAIEAHPDTYQCLRETVQRSGLTNVTPVHCAVGAEDGEVSISDGAAGHLTSSIMVGGTRKVKMRSLDSLADEFGLGMIDLLRMNIEGAEKEAVKGMDGLAPRVRNLFISCHDFITDSIGDTSFKSYAEVRAFLDREGFKVTPRSAEPGRPWLRDYLYGTR